MAALISINGMDNPTANDGATLTPHTIGDAERGAGVGEMRDARRGLKEDGDLTMTPQAAAEADAWEGIILGRGVRWSFDESLVSDMGLPPNTGHSATLGTTAPAAAFGYARAKVPSATTLAYSFNIVSKDARWSVMYRFWNGASWDHYVVRSDGNKYKNGVNIGTAVGAVSVSAALSITSGTGILSVTVTLKGRNITDLADADAFYDELVFMPWIFTATLLAAHYTANVVWGKCPRINISGAATETGTMECYGEITGRKYLQADTGGGFANNNRILSFALKAV